MFILTDKESGGVYAVQTKTLNKTVQIFEEWDDAERYKDLLYADDYPDELEIMEVETEVVALNCEKYGYKYTVVEKNDLVIPPD